MTDHNKKGSFNWWIIIAIALLLWGLGTAYTTDHQRLHNYEYPLEETLLEEEPDFSLAIADGHHEYNVCFFADTTLFDETVQIIYPDYNPEDKVIGRWHRDYNTIELMKPNGMNVQTVAHEVSHMVDTFMERYPGIDPHYEAYLQGFWTWCVYEIMQHDLRCMEDPFCNVR